MSQSGCVSQVTAFCSGLHDTLSSRQADSIPVSNLDTEAAQRYMSVPSRPMASQHISSGVSVLLKYQGLAGLGISGQGAHSDSVQQHGAGDADAVADLALDADGHVGPDLAVLADLGGGVHDVVAHKLGAGGQVPGGAPPEGRQVQLQSCRAIQDLLGLGISVSRARV